jgi:hypothetical protein
MGPQKQLRMMFDPVRLYATAVYVGCVVLALIFALWVRIFELFLFFLSHGIILFFFTMDKPNIITQEQRNYNSF